MPITIKERNQRYRQKNPDKFRECQKRYWNRKYECECGAVLTNKYRPKHLKSDKHAFMMQFKTMKDKINEIENTSESSD